MRRSTQHPRDQQVDALDFLTDNDDTNSAPFGAAAVLNNNAEDLAETLPVQAEAPSKLAARVAVLAGRSDPSADPENGTSADAGDDPTVSTNRLDYPPGSTATITAKDFTPNTTIEFQVETIVRPGPDGIYGTKDDVLAAGPGSTAWFVSDGASGSVQTSWYVDPYYLDMTMLLTATDLAPGPGGSLQPTEQTAQTVFSDSAPLEQEYHLEGASHGRRRFSVSVDVSKAPFAVEAVRRIDAIFAIEREINGLSAEERLAVPKHASRRSSSISRNGCVPNPPRLSRHAEVARAMDYMLKRWPAFTRFLDDGRICLTNNAAERALRGIALGRKAWLFAGSDCGEGARSGYVYLDRHSEAHEVDPQAWLADINRWCNTILSDSWYTV